MCYTGGPYCTKPALKAYEKAQVEFKATMTEESYEALKKAKTNYFTSPGGIEKLREAGKHEEADKCARQRELGIERAREIDQAKLLGDPNTDSNLLHQAAVSGHRAGKVAVANNPGISMRTLEHIVKNETDDDFRFAVARHPKATPEMVDWAASHESLRAKKLALENINASRETIDKVRHDAREKYLKTKDGETPWAKEATKESSDLWKRTRTLLEGPNPFGASAGHIMANKSIPRDGAYKKYYEDTDAKHFSDKEKPGSKFTDPRIKNLNDLAAVTYQQRGSLDGDDRATLIKYGANPENLSPDFRYLVVKTPGKLGSQDISTFPVDTKFRIERTKEGASCSVVADVKSQANVNFGVLIMGKVDGKDAVITAHPGFPARMSKKDTFGDYEGRTLSMNHVMEIAGSEKVNVNTRVI